MLAEELALDFKSNTALQINTVICHFRARNTRTKWDAQIQQQQQQLDWRVKC